MSHGMSSEDIREENQCNGAVMLSARGQGKVIGRPGMSRKMTKDASRGVTVDADKDDDEDLEAPRASLLAGKQSELEKVFDRHDTLVREVFHMENFRMMLDFDPREAKTEDSRVFQEYKSQYDLLEKTDTTSSPVRRTRRAHTERRQFISSSMSTPATVSPTWIARKNVQSPRTPKAPKDVARDYVVHDHEGAKSKVNIRSQMQKENGIISDDDEKLVQRYLDLPRTPIQRKNDALLSSKGQQREVLGGESVDINDGHQNAVGMSSLPVTPRRSERHKTLCAITAVPQAESVQEALPQPDSAPATPSKRQIQQIDGFSEPPKFKIKRIKLIVRRPPPSISHPAQRPPQPKFNSSLQAFLSSFISPFEKVVEEAILERQVQKEAALLERAYKLRQEGRFLPPSEGTTPQSLAEFRASSAVPRVSKDIWDYVVESAIAHGRARKRVIGQHIAGQIATKIKAYWEAQEVKRDKLRMVTEKQLRILARDTMRMVVNEWRKAVFHIREKERLRLEEEERRLGHEHLDAILNQSGYILRTQYGDLLRNGASRSRSHSVAVSDNEEGGFDEGEEGVEYEDEDEEELHQSDEEEELVGSMVAEPEVASDGGLDDGVDGAEEGDGGFDTRMLLGGVALEESPEQQDISASPEDHTHDIMPERDSSSRQTSPSIATPHLIDEETDDGVESSLGTLLYPDDVVGETDARADDIVFTSSKRLSSVSDSTLTVTEQNISLSLASREETGEEVPTADLTSEEPAQTQEAIASQQQEESVNEGSAVKDTDDEDGDPHIPVYLRPYAVAPVDWDPGSRITPPLLLRGVLRPYQQVGLEWLASLHLNHLNGILADEMGLGKTIQTIALLAHLACDRGIWGPHLIIVPTSVLLNWEMEFKKFLPGFKTLSYHGSTKRRKELRQGWNDKHHFNVCITSYTLASRDAHIFKRKPWYYMVLDEAHMIKNFKSNRWNTLLMFRSFRRLLLTGTPLQNNLTELWALLKFLMSGTNFANLREFAEWFSNPLEKAIEMGNILDDETKQRVSKLHTVLRPYLLRRLKCDVEKELPSKFEHLVLCPLSRRQRFLYDEFMSRAQTRDALQSGVYQKIANVLMQLRKVCNHPDLFEVRPIVTSFVMTRSAIADFEIKELLLRRRLLREEERVDLGLLGLQFVQHQNIPLIMALETRRLDATSQLIGMAEIPGEPPPKDLTTIAGFRAYSDYMRRTQTVAHWTQLAYLNRYRCNVQPIYGQELITTARHIYQPILPLSAVDLRYRYMDTCRLLSSAAVSYELREEMMANYVNRFAFITPTVVALDLPRISLSGHEQDIRRQPVELDQILHRASVKLQIAFPDPSLLQYDCGKLQQLAQLLREKKAGGHRVLIFTQMTRVLDILEIFLNLHSYLYLRLDGATKIEDRQYITERFNADERIFCFISSSRSGGVGINLTGADTVIFYDSDFNPQMDRQCEDRAHRIGQMRDVHIYRFVSQYTVEEAMLRKANQKRSLDDLVIQKGEFDWRSLFHDEGALTKALEEFEDTEDAFAAAMAAREEIVMGDADEADFADDSGHVRAEVAEPSAFNDHTQEAPAKNGEGIEDEQGGTTIDYMIAFVEQDYDFFRDWRI